MHTIERLHKRPGQNLQVDRFLYDINEFPFLPPEYFEQQNTKQNRVVYRIKKAEQETGRFIVGHKEIFTAAGIGIIGVAGTVFLTRRTLHAGAKI